MRRRICILAAAVLAALAAAVPAADAGVLLQAGGITPCVSPTDPGLIEAFHVSGLLANKGIVQAAENDRFQLELEAEVYDLFPPDPSFVSRLAPAAFAIEPLRQEELRAGSTVELAAIDWGPPPDDGRVWKQLLDQRHLLRVDVTATLVLVDGAGQAHALDQTAMQATIEP